jgi:conjugal transfer mating pair stabilization protein TraG
MMPVYVIANGELFRQTFNAIVTLVYSKSFLSAQAVTFIFSLYMIMHDYFKTGKMNGFFTWFAMYVAMANVVLLPKVSLEIIDSSNPGAVYTVDHVPFGLGYPFSIITSLGYTMQRTFEMAYHMPDDETYSKTGMLFGSQLFRLSTGAQAMSSDVQQDLNQFVKNCVIGDMLINHKYSFSDLKNSTDIWGLVTSKPSPVRSMAFHDGTINTCQASVALLKKEIQQDIDSNIIKSLAKRVFGHKNITDAKALIQKHLPSAYNYYAGISKNASQILTQNVMINAMKQGIRNYANETNATASMINLSSTTAMSVMRAAWATTKNIATYKLPILQSVMTLLMLACFPIMLLMWLLGTLGKKSLKMYFLTLIWLESWALMYACLNIAMTFYAHHQTLGMASEGITLATINALATLHADIAGVAGGLLTAIPFISLGLVVGMPFAFNNAANYLGGMTHSVAQSAANEVVTGNISRGNMSYGNVSANKWDTNATHFHGMHTEQLANGATVTDTAAGGHIVNGVAAISQLGTGAMMRSSISSDLSHQAGQAKSAAEAANVSMNESLSSAVSHGQQSLDNAGHTENLGHGYSNSQTAAIDHAANGVMRFANQMHDKYGINQNDTLRAVDKWSSSAGVKVGTPKLLSSFISANAGIDVGYEKQSGKEYSKYHGNDIDISQEEANALAHDWKTLQNYGQSHHFDQSDNRSHTYGEQMANDLRDAHTFSESYSANIQKSQQLNDQASFVEHSSVCSDENVSQAITDYAYRHYDSQTATQALTGQTDRDRQARHDIVNDVLNEKRSELQQKYESEKLQYNPRQLYSNATEKVNQKNNVVGNYAAGKQSIAYKKDRLMTDTQFNARANKLKTSVRLPQAKIHQIIQDVENQSILAKQAFRNNQNHNIKVGQENADRSSIGSVCHGEKN